MSYDVWGHQHSWNESSVMVQDTLTCSAQYCWVIAAIASVFCLQGFKFCCKLSLIFRLAASSARHSLAVNLTFADSYTSLHIRNTSIFSCTLLLRNLWNYEEQDFTIQGSTFANLQLVHLISLCSFSSESENLSLEFQKPILWHSTSFNDCTPSLLHTCRIWIGVSHWYRSKDAFTLCCSSSTWFRLQPICCRRWQWLLLETLIQAIAFFEHFSLDCCIDCSCWRQAFTMCNWACSWLLTQCFQQCGMSGGFCFWSIFCKWCNNSSTIVVALCSQFFLERMN